MRCPQDAPSHKEYTSCMKRRGLKKRQLYNVHLLLLSLGTTGHHSVTIITSELQSYIDEKWSLHSHALSVMKTEERHFAETCAEHFTEVLQQWNLSDKVTTLGTDSAPNMITATRQLPFDHVPCFVHSLQHCVTVSLHNSAFDNVLPKCRNLWGTSNTVQQVQQN